MLCYTLNLKKLGFLRPSAEEPRRRSGDHRGGPARAGLVLAIGCLLGFRALRV